METVLVKIGGSTLDAPDFFTQLAKSVQGTSREYFQIIVHGGGKDIARQLELQNKKYSFIEGMRVTDAHTAGVVQMVLSGDVNKRLVNALQTFGGVKSIGISGVDCGFLTASRMLIKGRDIGFVGQIDSIDLGIIELCKKNGIVAVVSPISRDTQGNIYNVNADLAAGEIAKKCKADHLVFVSDVPGVKIDGVVKHRIGIGELEGLIRAGQITGGMVPKVRSAAEAVLAGVKQVHVCGWNGENTLARELDQATMTGTVISK
jgi:acetylglutamate kinase